MASEWSGENTLREEESEPVEQVPQISLILRTVNGREASMHVPYTIEITTLKELVALEFNETVERVMLIYRGKRLNGEDKLSKYIMKSDIEETHCIHVVFHIHPTTATTTESSTTQSDTQASSTHGAPGSRNRTATVVHNLPAGISLDTLRLGPSAQFSVTTSSNIPGVASSDLISGPAILQSLISSLGHANVTDTSGHFNTLTNRRSNDNPNDSNSSVTNPPETSFRRTLENQQTVVNGDNEDTFSSTQPLSGTLPHSVLSAATNASTTGENTTTATSRTQVEGSSPATNETNTSRPQQVRVTLGSLPVSLGSGGLGQLFQTVLGQLGGTTQIQQPPVSRARRISSRQRGGSVLADYSLRRNQPSFVDPTEPDISGESDTRQENQPPLPPGLTAFLRRTVGILSDSRRGVTRASETILETLEDVLTQASRRNSGRQQSSGILSLPQRQASSSERRLGSVWVSNECISEELPWDNLTQLAHVIRRATGWELPDLAQESGTGNGSLSLARFLLAFQQLSAICSAVLAQIEAWQRGTGRLRVADIGHSIEILALSSLIQANLASLFSWLFLHLSRHVDPAMLYERMHWDAFSNDQHSTRQEEDDDAFVDTRESPHQDTTNCNLLQTTTNSEANGGASSDVTPETYTLANTISRKRFNDEDGCDTNITNVELGVEDSTNVKKQRTTESCTTSSSSSSSSSTDPTNTVEESEDASQLTSLCRLENAVKSCPTVLRSRVKKWICNQEAFSKAVLAQARTRPLSNAYASNTCLESSKISCLHAQSLFQLCLDQTASRCNIETTCMEQLSKELNKEYIAFLLKELVESVQENPDYQQESYRFPHVKIALEHFKNKKNIEWQNDTGRNN